MARCGSNSVGAPSVASTVMSRVAVTARASGCSAGLVGTVSSGTVRSSGPASLTSPRTVSVWASSLRPLLDTCNFVALSSHVTVDSASWFPVWATLLTGGTDSLLAPVSSVSWTV